MTITEAKRFYEKDTKDYEIEKNKDFLTWLKTSIKNGYHCFMKTEELQELIDSVVNWYEIKYPERELEYFEGTRHLGFQDIRRISDVMDIRQLLFRLPHNQLCLMECGYRAKGWGQYPIYENGKEIDLTTNLKIKKALLLPLRFFKKSKFWKKRALSLGCSICCPSVTINTKITGKSPYKTELKCDLDWDTWDKMIEYKGKFLYIPKELMQHRIHEESETSNLIENNIRLEEDYIMFKRYWPEPIAKFLMKFYGKAIKTNEM